MNTETNPIDKLDFLLGKWHLEYDIPKSSFSEKDEGEGTGEFRKILNDKYVEFKYSAKVNAGSGAAQGIFAWDEKTQLYRYWWFEDSGSYLSATCNFSDDNTLNMNWHDSLLIQSFKKEKDDKVVLRMKYPSGENGYTLILKVIFTRIEQINE